MPLGPPKQVNDQREKPTRQGDERVKTARIIQDSVGGVSNYNDTHCDFVLSCIARSFPERGTISECNVQEYLKYQQ